MMISVKKSTLIFMLLFGYWGGSLLAQDTPAETPALDTTKPLNALPAPLPPPYGDEEVTSLTAIMGKGDPTYGNERIKKMKAVFNDQGEILYRTAHELASTWEGCGAALARFNDFLVLYPNHKRKLDVLIESGGILKKLDRREEAIGYYMDAYRLSGHSERGRYAYFMVGRLKAELGDQEEATAVFQKLSSVPSRIAQAASIELRGLRFLDTGNNRNVYGRINTPRVETSDPVKEYIPDESSDADKRDGFTGAFEKGVVTSGNENEKSKESGTSELDDPFHRMGEGVERNVRDR